MDLTNLNRKLIAVQCPGVIEDDENFIKCLGGRRKMAEVFTSDKQRLALTMNPSNIYSKPVYSDPRPTVGLLLKVTIKHPNEGRSDAQPIYSVSIIGQVEKVYRFSAMCDYQYLPVARIGPQRQPEFIYDKLYTQDILSHSKILNQRNVPYFLPPPVFSRFDQTIENLFKKETTRLDPNRQEPDNIVTVSRRSRRGSIKCYIPFSMTEPIPSTSDGQLDAIRQTNVKEAELELVRQKFIEKPIWSRMGLIYDTKLSTEKLKIILPLVSFYYTTGPWRIMWVRLGYDMRIDFNSRYFQSLDYRVRKSVLQRTETIHPKTVRHKLRRSTGDGDKEFYYPYFEENHLPQSIHCFYQYCDIRIGKIQEMLDKIPTPMSGAKCNEKTGWLPAGFDNQCREIMNEIMIDLLKSKQTDVTSEQDNEPDERSEDEEFDEEYDEESFENRDLEPDDEENVDEEQLDDEQITEDVPVASGSQIWIKEEKL